MKTEDKKKILSAYKERKITGGICAIKNTVTKKLLLEITTDIQGLKNRFEFSQKTGVPFSLLLQKDYTVYGVQSFSLEELELITKEDTKTMEEFKEELNILKEIWQEKFKTEDLY